MAPPMTPALAKKRRRGRTRRQRREAARLHHAHVVWCVTHASALYRLHGQLTAELFGPYIMGAERLATLADVRRRLDVLHWWETRGSDLWRDARDPCAICNPEAA